MNHLALLTSAADFAAKKHKGQRRKGANREPYINHPLEVAKLLAEVGRIDTVEILAAAILHDTIEDTDTTEEELQGIFGSEIVSIVLEVTDDKSLPKQERKRLQIEKAPNLSVGAKHVKLADKISNVEDMTENPPEHWSVRRRIEYVEWGIAVVHGLKGVNSELETAFDAAAERAKTALLKK